MANAQLTIKPAELYNKGGELTHRFLVLVGATPVAREINCFLQQNVLDYETCLPGDDVLVRELLSPNDFGGLVALNY